MLWEMYEKLAKASNQFLLYRYGAHGRLIEDVESREYANEIGVVLSFDIQNHHSH